MSSADSWLSRTGARRGGESAASRRTSLREVLGAQRAGLPWAVLALLLTGMLLGMGLYVLSVTGQPLNVLVQDANALARQPNYFGGLEHAEILLMNGAGWIAAFSALFCRGQVARFLFLGGLLSLLLAADDLYMFHESAWRFQIREFHVFAVYGLLLLLLITTSLRYFLTTPFILLGLALVLFALAVLIDVTERTPFGLPRGTEDCLELAGVSFWAVYFAWCSRDGLRNRALPPAG